MNDTDNFNNEIELEAVYQVEPGEEKTIVKKQRKIITKMENNLQKIVLERISGRTGEC